MAGPWEKFAASPEQGPWSKFAPAEPQLDQYQQAAVAERDALRAQGVDTGAGLVRRVAQGATFNAADEIMAAATTPFEMIKRGTINPREAYNYAKAREDLIMDDARKNTGIAGTAAELTGGLMSGAGLAGAGVTFAPRAANAGLGARSAASAADAAALGAVSGLGEGNSFSERFGNAGMGAALGGGIGGLTPGALKVAGAVLSPITSNISARLNPTNFAQSQVARGISESGRTPQQIADDLAFAAQEGQGMFTAADAMGNAGQRLLSSTARAPGQGRTAVVEFLENRQAGQGRRIANTLSEGFNAPTTAAQTEAQMVAARSAAANAEYGAVRNASEPVDLVGTLNHLDRTIGTQPGQVITPANDSIEAVLTPFRQRLARVNPDDFEAVQRIRGDMADAAQSATQSGYGNRARLIGSAVRELDAAMEGASQGFRQANANFARASRNIKAIDTGRQAAARGRTEDIIPQFRGLPAEGQAAYRAGYVDPLIQQAQGAAHGVNKARPLLNDAFAAESQAIAPLRYGQQMARRIDRENTMFQTRNAAMGNSKTAENLADDAAMGINPTLVGNLLSGNWSGAARGALQSGQNALTGNTPQVRAEMARLLLSGDGSNLETIMQQAIAQARQRQLIAAALGRGGSAAVALSPSATGMRK